MGTSETEKRLPEAKPKVWFAREDWMRRPRQFVADNGGSGARKQARYNNRFCALLGKGKVSFDALARPGRKCISSIVFWRLSSRWWRLRTSSGRVCGPESI